MADQTLVELAVVLLALGFLRFGAWVSDFLCRTIDPAPEIIDEYRP